MPPISYSAVVHVSSIPALQSAITIAAAGDTLVLANGTYFNSTLTLSTSNITVKAATPGGVHLNGTNRLVMSGSHVTFSGFQFTSGDIDSSCLIEVSGSHNLLTQLNFNGYFAKTYIVVMGGSQYNEISYCNIENKPATAVSGCTIQIHLSPTVVGYHKIRYCSFRHFPGAGGDYGNEPIRIGLSTERAAVSRTIVEHCYFEDVGLGDGESISLKSCENVCRYNTFTNNPRGMLVFRQGNNNVAYGNFFINGSGGIRIKCGNSQFVFNNYFDTGSADALVLQYVAENPIHNINIIHNTFADMGGIALGGPGPAAVTFANNIFLRSSGKMFSDPNGGTVWTGNMFSGTLGIAISSGMTNADPHLVKNSDGYFGLSSLSPAIDASSSDYPSIIDIEGIDDDPSLLLDIGGQPRPAVATLKDVGCDEYATGGTRNRPLTLAEVGPSYLRATAFSESEALHTAHEWASLVGQANVAELEKLLSDNYIHIHATALVESKAQFLDAFRNGSRKYDPITFEDVTVRVFGSSAVVTGKFTLKAFARGKTIEGVNRFGLVLVKTPKGKQVVSFQATRVPKQG